MSAKVTVLNPATDLLTEVERALRQYGGKIILVCSPRTRPQETIILTVTHMNAESLTGTEEGKEEIRLLNWKDLKVWMVSTICARYVYLCTEARELLRIFPPQAPVLVP